MAHNEKTVIFLGAGASAADNAPLQKDIFREYFRRDTKQRIEHAWDREISTQSSHNSFDSDRQGYLRQ